MSKGVHKIALRVANVEVVLGLQARLAGKTFGAGKASAEHLRWLCGELLNNLGRMPPDKSGRWIGFIQGVMVCNGVLDVDEERDRTRPIYQRAYFTGP